MKNISSYLLIILILLGACTKEQSAPSSNLTNISFSNILITDVTVISASINYKINSNNNIIEQGIVWSLNPKPTLNDNKISIKSAQLNNQIVINSLQSSKKYYVRIFAINQMGIFYSNDIEFTTVDFQVPILITDNVTSFYRDTAIFSGTIVHDGNSTIINRGFCWSTNPNPKMSDSSVIVGAGTFTGAYSKIIKSLIPNTKYYIRSFASNSKGIGFGNIVSFTTSPIGIPEITTLPISFLTYNSAISGGVNLNASGGQITNKGICYSNTPNPTIQSAVINGGPGLSGFTSNLLNLNFNTTYYIRAFATNSAGTNYGNEITFTTDDVQLPFVNSTNASNIDQTSASIGVSIINNSSAPIIEKGICWNISPTPTINNYRIIENTSNNYFTSTLMNLNPNSTYYARAYARNIAGTSYGQEISFTTLQATLASININNPTNITNNSFYITASINNNGYSAITQKGFCYSSSPNPTVNSNITNQGSGNGIFNSLINGLNSNTTYYIRAYATNSIGTSYSNQIIVNTN
jgi:hypothetical protein